MRSRNHSRSHLATKIKHRVFEKTVRTEDLPLAYSFFLHRKHWWEGRFFFNPCVLFFGCLPTATPCHDTPWFIVRGSCLMVDGSLLIAKKGVQGGGTPPPFPTKSFAAFVSDNAYDQNSPTNSFSKRGTIRNAYQTLKQSTGKTTLAATTHAHR